MPLIDVTCGPAVSDEARRTLAAALPVLVSRAVACESEPYDGQLRRGDVLVRFRDVGPFDRMDLDLLVEVRSKWTNDRDRDRQRRAGDILDGLRTITSYRHIGVFLRLPTASWAQTGGH